MQLECGSNKTKKIKKSSSPNIVRNFANLQPKSGVNQKKRSSPEIGTDFSRSFVVIAITRHFFV